MSGLYMRGGQSKMDLYVEHIQVLKWILDKTDARIVISSTWRLGKTVDELKQMFYNYGLPSRYVIDKTPRFAGKERGDEIGDWLSTTSHEIESYVILDDDADMNIYMSALVQTNHDYGLTYVEGHRAVEMLNGKERANEDFHNEMMENEN